MAKQQKITKQTRRQKNKARKIRKMERQDANGISRIKNGKEFSARIFFILKIVFAILIPVFYWVYSPFLIFPVIGILVLFFLSFRVENKINDSYLKSKQIHLSKTDSALALVLIVLSITGGIMNLSKTQFNSRMITRSLTNISACLTGERSILGRGGLFHFGITGKPDGFIANKEEFHDMYGSADGFTGTKPPSGDFTGGHKFGGGGKGFGGMKINFSMDNIPLEYLFSSLLSAINTILLFGIAFFAILSFFQYRKDKKKLALQASIPASTDEILLLSEKQIEEIIHFDYTYLSKQEWKEKCKEEKEKRKEERKNRKKVIQNQKKERKEQERKRIASKKHLRKL